MTKRRDLLILGAALATPLVGFQLWQWRAREDGFSYEPIEGAPGFRRIEGGAVSLGSSDPLVGIRVPGEHSGPTPLPAADLCRVLFGTPRPGTVPVASFSDYYCPYCRDLTLRLADRAGAGLAVTWHELPIFGAASETAARAALAADLQGAYPAVQARLMRAAFQPTPAYLTGLAEGIGIDPARLMEDMESGAVTRRLLNSRRAALRLGIWATPTLVVGRTVVMGAISDARLDALIEDERASESVC